MIGVYSLGAMTILGREGLAGDNGVLQVVIDFFPLVPTLKVNMINFFV